MGMVSLKACCELQGKWSTIVLFSLFSIFPFIEALGKQFSWT